MNRTIMENQKLESHLAENRSAGCEETVLDEIQKKASILGDKYEVIYTLISAENCEIRHIQ